MNKQDFYDEIMGSEIFDTHTHLIGDRLCARSFMEIGGYSWFLSELQAAGYSKDAANLPEERQIEAYLKAFNATRNTAMHWIVRSIFNDLYGIELKDARSILEAEEAVRGSSIRTDWAKTVADKLSIKKIVVNEEKDAGFKNLDNASVYIPRIETQIGEWADRIQASTHVAAEAESVESEIDALLNALVRKGCKGVMTAWEGIRGKTYGVDVELRKSGNTREEIVCFLLHQVCKSAEKYGLLIQLFLGMEHGWNNRRTAVNDPFRIIKLHGLFEKYSCRFDLVLASEVNHMDAVQAARIFPNVHVGGLWWYSFRPSIFKECMQKRFEALPPASSSFIVSDSRCIEWCYGKCLLIKRLMADYLYEQVKKGWIDREGALEVARQWLYESAAAWYIE